MKIKERILKEIKLKRERKEERKKKKIKESMKINVILKNRR
jgi:hypothetical protein